MAPSKPRVIKTIISEVDQRCVSIKPKFSIDKTGARLFKVTKVKSKPYTGKCVDLGNNGICTICMDSIANMKKVWTTCCNKTFHSRCLLKWCQANLESPACPLCRSPIETVKVNLRVEVGNKGGTKKRMTSLIGYVINDVRPPKESKPTASKKETKSDFLHIICKAHARMHMEDGDL